MCAFTHPSYFILLSRPNVPQNILSRQDSPSRCISSMTRSDTALTYVLFCQLLLTPSHFSGVVTITSALAIALISGITSPVSSTTLENNYKKRNILYHCLIHLIYYFAVRHGLTFKLYKTTQIKINKGKETKF